MKTATLAPPPRPPRNGNPAGGLGEPAGGGKSGRHNIILGWCQMGLKLVVVILLLVVVAQLVIILFQSVRLWFFT